MSIQLLQGDCIEVMKTLPAGSVQTCVTSPPFWALRDYNVDGQIGLEASPSEYVQRLVEVFREVWRVLADNGTLWLNLGDSYSNIGKNGGHSYGKNYTSAAGGYQTVRDMEKQMGNLKPKDLVGIPWRVAFALQDDGWYLRSDIIWHKLNPMPESVTDRPTKAHEYIFLLSKQEQYFYNAEAIKEPSTGQTGNAANFKRTTKEILAPGQVYVQHREDRKSTEDTGTRNKRDVWTVASKPYSGAHFATFPPKLIEPCILAGSRPGDTVLDPFNGAGTSGLVSIQHNRDYIGIDLNPDYLQLSRERFTQGQPLLFEVSA
jgi:DNA modification methylase